MLQELTPKNITFFHMAVRKGIEDAVVNKFLAQNRGYLNARVGTESGSDGFSPIDTAAQSDYPNMIRVLVREGVDLQAECRRGETTPLHMAAMTGKAENIRVLCELGATPYIDNVDSNGLTPLFYAAMGAHHACIATLLDLGADRNHKSNNGFTAEQIALSQAPEEEKWRTAVLLRTHKRGDSIDWLKSPQTIAPYAAQWQTVTPPPVATANTMEIDQRGTATPTHTIK